MSSLPELLRCPLTGKYCACPSWIRCTVIMVKAPKLKNAKSFCSRPGTRCSLSAARSRRGPAPWPTVIIGGVRVLFENNPRTLIYELKVETCNNMHGFNLKWPRQTLIQI